MKPPFHPYRDDIVYGWPLSAYQLNYFLSTLDSDIIYECSLRFMRLYARYPYTHFHFGNTESSWIIRDILTDSYQIWKINKWHHICFSYSESNSHISLVKVRYIQEYFFWWYKIIGRCWWIISEFYKVALSKLVCPMLSFCKHLSLVVNK